MLDVIAFNSPADHVRITTPTESIPNAYSGFRPDPQRWSFPLFLQNELLQTTIYYYNIYLCNSWITVHIVC